MLSFPSKICFVSQAAPLPMKMVVARAPKEEKDAAPSNAGAKPLANEAVFQVARPPESNRMQRSRPG